MGYLEHIFSGIKLVTQGRGPKLPALHLHCSHHCPMSLAAVGATMLSRLTGEGGGAECKGCCCCSQTQPMEMASSSECDEGNAVVCLHCRVHLSVAKKS